MTPPRPPSTLNARWLQQAFPAQCRCRDLIEVKGRVLTAETLIVGAMPNGRNPAIRRLLADGLFRHIEILRGHPDLIDRAGSGPSWCHYQGGPWPVPHDAMVELRITR